MVYDIRRQVIILEGVCNELGVYFYVRKSGFVISNMATNVNFIQR